MSALGQGGSEPSFDGRGKAGSIRQHLLDSAAAVVDNQIGGGPASQADADAFLKGSRKRFLERSFPKRPMGQYTYRSWIRWMLLTGLLNGYEDRIARALHDADYTPSPKQRQVLWRALHRIFPEGCTKWGRP